jgi:hypothetical protein
MGKTYTQYLKESVFILLHGVYIWNVYNFTVALFVKQSHTKQRTKFRRKVLNLSV